ncbi:MAG: MBL fold metallo-hydrolase [Candidatus Sungbacteria bacterium]|nr:MBL fold metallo-hydrolase [Candidatus Sungbacteria bacterium]
MRLFHRVNFFQYTVLGFAVAAGLIWFAVFKVEAAGGLLRVHFFDVGQGDAIFVEAENGNQVLIDGGPNGSVLAKLGEVMPFWDKSIDIVILTHPHADHLDGLIEVLKRYDIDMVLETGVSHSIPEYEEWRRLLKEKNVKVVVAKAGQKVQLSDSVFLDILAPFGNFEGVSPKNVHDSMIVSKLVNGSASLLLMGDAEKQIEYRLLFSGADMDADILKAGHHGSKTSTSEEFLRVVSPEVAVISAGRKNRYGHPHQEVIDRLESFGIKIFRTDIYGDVVFVSDGLTFQEMP